MDKMRTAKLIDCHGRPCSKGTRYIEEECPRLKAILLFNIFLNLFGTTWLSKKYSQCQILLCLSNKNASKIKMVLTNNHC